MHDIKAIREDRDGFVKGLERRGLEGADALADGILAQDKSLRELLTRLQTQQARRNDASKLIGQAKQKKDEALAKSLLDEVAGLKDEIQKGEAEQRELEEALKSALAVIPNIPAVDVPDGADESANALIAARAFGKPPGINNPKQHFEIGEGLGQMDFERAAKVSGARFVYLKADLARLERAIAAFMLDTHTEKFGYTEVSPPVLVRNSAMFGTGQLPKFHEDLFSTATTFTKRIAKLSGQIERDEWFIRRSEQEKKQYPKLYDADSDFADAANRHLRAAMDLRDAAIEKIAEIQKENPTTSKSLWLIPTAEVPLTNYVADEILNEAELPLRMTAFTPCFRAEAGAAGKDTRGMIRMHQFSKVELVSITTPEQSSSEHERMTDAAQEILKKLDLAHRVVTLCTGDMGFSAQKTYDIEVWLPGQNAYREISSCSNCGAFQARRMNTRFRNGEGKVQGPVHTLNGSGLAVGRTLVAILENYQQEDGSVAISAGIAALYGWENPYSPDLMRILVTNDDGIHAPGLAVAEEIARTISDDVWMVAPEGEQSGASHSLTLTSPLRLRQISERRFAVSGTPTDCVMMAALHILKAKPPELVLSGINWGSNMADDVTYSGTIAGAMEGCALGIASIALSQAGEDRETIDWSPGAVHGAPLIRRLLEAGWPKGTLININFPGCAAADVKGTMLVPQGHYDLQSTEIEERLDARSRPYYWIGLRRRKAVPPKQSDLGAVYDDRIAVTPLHMNLTDTKALEKMRQSLGHL